MLEAIEKLLILQDRDRRLLKMQEELRRIPVERQQLDSQSVGAQTALDAAKLRGKQIESERKKLELDVEAKRQQMEKYAVQQLQTKKNDEYRALANEIEGCKRVIFGLEDQQIELMEQAEAAQRAVQSATQHFNEVKKIVEGRVADMNAREKNLTKEMEDLAADRARVAETVDEVIRSKYERLLKNKGATVVVGIPHEVCGGCHMKLNRHIVVTCQGSQDIITCPNCGRILYFTRDMDMAVAE